ncbi:MAG TPA: GrpB family protein [Streptosporangiaceae bacterium]|jgi:dephospho-CoA kinase
MLLVGLPGCGHAHPAARRLTELGALPGTLSMPPPWDLADPSVVVLTGTGPAGGAGLPGLHLVLGTAAGPEADVVLDGTPGQLGELWAGRLVPFEASLRAGRRAPRRDHPRLIPPDPSWPAQARRLIDRFRVSAGRQIIRVDHIGSTSVPGLPAKELIDIQVVVDGLEAAGQVAGAARRAGFVHVPGQWSGTDRHGTGHPEEVVVDADPRRPVNINIRPAGAPVWRETLLFRDWMRRHDAERDAYAAMKQDLAGRSGMHVDDYSVAKMPWISAAMARASNWAAATGWSP